jgi:uncharacterized protein
LSALLAVILAAAQQIEIPPPPRGYGTSAAEIVVDAAGVLDPAAVERINRIAFELRARTGGEIAVVTMPDLRGRDVGDVALRIGREWGVGAAAAAGDPSKNAGVVVLLVPKETASDNQGRISIQTGRGVEGFITDGVAGDIRRAATPLFIQRDYSGGLVLIVSEIANRFAREFGVSLDSSVVPRPQFREPSSNPLTTGPSIGTFLFLLFVIFLILNGLSRSRRYRGGGSGCLNLLWAISVAQSHGRRGGWGSGGFGGGSFGGGGGFGGFGGGGGFSGGGSSGSW